MSRRRGFEDFVVVDTDDGKEEIASWSKLRHVVQKGVAVEGVSIVKSPIGGHTCLISVYQPPETISQLQLKAKILQGVEIKTYGSRITDILLHGSRCKVVVKLSDFGTSLADCIFAGNYPGCKGDITFVLDSKLKIGYEPFALSRIELFGRFTIGGLGVKLDVRNILGESVFGLYKAVFEVGYDDAFNEIIDSDERKSLMRERVRGLC